MSRHHDPIIDTPQRPHRQHAGHTAVDIPSLGDSPAARPPAANASPPRRLLSMGALSNATTARTVARSPSGHPCLVAMDTLQREISALNTQMQRVGNALVNLNKIRAQQSTTPVPTPNMVFKSCGGLLHCIATVSGELHAERWQRVESAARRWGEHDSTMDVVTVLDLAMCAAMTTLGELAADVSTKVCGVGQPLPIVTGHRTVAEAPPPLRRVSSEAHHEQQRREPFTTPLQSPRRASSQSRASTVSTNAADPSTRPARPALSPATRHPTAHPPAHPQTPTVTPEVSPQVTPTGHKAAQVPLSPFKAASREVAFEALPPRVADPAITQPPRRRTSSDADDTSTAFVRQLSAPKPLQKTTSLSRLQRLREMGIGALGRSIDNGAADSVVCPGS